MSALAARLAAAHRGGKLPAPRSLEDIDDLDSIINAVRLLVESLTPGQLRRIASSNGTDAYAPTMVPRYVMRAAIDAVGHTYLPEATEELEP